MHHPVSEKITDCKYCGIIDSLTKLPSSFSLKKEQTKQKKIGDEVKSAIEGFKTDLQEEKNNLKNREWISDD